MIDIAFSIRIGPDRGTCMALACLNHMRSASYRLFYLSAAWNLFLSSVNLADDDASSILLQFFVMVDRVDLGILNFSQISACFLFLSTSFSNLTFVSRVCFLFIFKAIVLRLSNRQSGMRGTICAGWRLWTRESWEKKMKSLLIIQDVARRGEIIVLSFSYKPWLILIIACCYTLSRPRWQDDSAFFKFLWRN